MIDVKGDRVRVTSKCTTEPTLMCYEEVKFVQLPHKNHDRFLIIDESVYLLGASVKDMGNGLCAVTKLQALPETILGMLK